MADVKTQAALDKALKANPGGEIRLTAAIAFALNLSAATVAPSLIIVMPGASLDAASYGGARLRIEARGNSTVTAWGNSTVTAWENSTVTAWENSTVTAWGNSTVTARGNSTVTAWENSTVTAWENSTVTARENSTVTARGNSTVTAWGYAFVRVFSARKVKASENCIVALHQADATPGEAHGVSGGRQLVCPPPETPSAWCDHYGVEVTDGIAILYKGVRSNFRSDRGGDYTPGTIPMVPVFKADPECGPGALYFSPAPCFTHRFIANPEHYVACPVNVSDIVVHPSGEYPEKVKAIGCCAPVWEVDVNGVAIAAPEPEAA